MSMKMDRVADLLASSSWFFGDAMQLFGYAVVMPLYGLVHLFKTVAGGQDATVDALQPHDKSGRNSGRARFYRQPHR